MSNTITLNGHDFELTENDCDMLHKWLVMRQRIDGVNKDALTRIVTDAIDRPIRGLVVQLNRIGLRTRFSCCGYTYDEEEEPKSHDRTAYVQYHLPPNDVHAQWGQALLSTLIDEWRTHTTDYYWYQDHTIDEHIRAIAVKINDNIRNMYQRSDDLPAIHDYEPFVLLIKWLEKRLKQFPSMVRECKIIDGNASALVQTDGEWLVKPKRPVMVVCNDHDEQSLSRFIDMVSNLRSELGLEPVTIDDDDSE